MTNKCRCGNDLIESKHDRNPIPQMPGLFTGTSFYCDRCDEGFVIGVLICEGVEEKTE